MESHHLSPSHPHPPSKKNRRRFRWYHTVVIVLIVIFLSVGVVGAYAASQVIAFKQALTAGQTALEEYRVADASAAFAQAKEHAQRLEQLSSGFPFLGSAPVIGEGYGQLQDTLHVGVEVLDVGQSALEIAQDVLAAVDRAHDVAEPSFLDDPRPFSDFSDSEKEAALQAFAKAENDMRAMRIALALAAQDAARLDPAQIPLAEVRAGVLQMQAALPKLVTTLDILTPFSAIASEFAGLSADRQFLVLFLNNAELRPGGGFIGAYSLVLVRDGDIVSVQTEDSYTADKYVMDDSNYILPPPYPLTEQLGVPDWYFRDAAWSPSFYETARDARQLLRQELAVGKQSIPEIHDVVGITPVFIQDVLRFIGPIMVEGSTYTAENLYDLLQYQVEQGFVDAGVAYEERKKVLKVLTEEMVSRLLELPPAKWLSFFSLFEQSLAQKDVVFASFNEDTQAHLVDAGWAGTPNPAAADDAIMVVDANLAALKTDPVVQRFVTYTLQPQSDTYRATLVIRYVHQGSFDWKTTRYRSYTRVYVPLGSKLVGVDGSLLNDLTKNPAGLPGPVVTEDAFGMTSFGTFIAIEPGKERTLTFTYDLPASVVHAIERGVYTLSALKQIGAGDNLLTLDLHFGTNLTAAEPAEEEEYFGDTNYTVDTTLSTDKVFRIEL